METMTLHVPKQKFLLLFAGASAFVAAGFWLMSKPVYAGRWDVMLAGWFGVMFFGVCAAFFAWRMVSSRPLLVIDDKGLTEYASAIAAGFIPWPEIRAADMASFLGQEYIAIHVIDEDKYVARCGPVKRAILNFNRSAAGSAILIPVVGLPVSADRVLSAIHARMTRP